MILLVVDKQFKICHLCFLIMNIVLQPLETKQQCISQSSTLSERGIRSRHQNSHSVLSGNRIHLCKVITIHGKSFIYLKVVSLIHRIYQGVRSSWLNDVTRVTNHFHLSNARERELLNRSNFNNQF